MESGSVRSVEVLVVGAGFAGLYQLYRLREDGFDVAGVEAGSSVGGTWYWNRYPGARCDVESMSYSYSWSPELGQEWEWSERYPAQPEICAYLDHVADRFDLRRMITFDNRVVAARFDEDTNRWRVETDAGVVFDARHIVMATGCLSIPKPPELAGVEAFEGELYMTSTWPDEPVDLAGKRVAVVGTGSSGIQTIPVVAQQAGQVTVFQRTPNFCLPAHNRGLTPDEILERKDTYAEWHQRAREAGFGVPAEDPYRSALSVTQGERETCYQGAWDHGDLVEMLGSYNDLLTDEAANETAAEFIRERIRETVSDPATAEKLSPRTFPFATKRPCLGTDYYETFNRDNVELVDLRATPIVEVTAKGLRTSEAEFEFDVLILATGFDAMTGALLAVDFVGRGGRRLSDWWADGPRSYMGLSVSGFPNLFTITGPGTPSVLTNVVVAVEHDVEWIANCLGYLRERGIESIEAEPAAEEAWVAHVDEMVDGTLYPRANSWWIGANVPGKPRRFMVYIGGLKMYRDKCAEIAAEGYTGFSLNVSLAERSS
jgi:cation diffusion facilitator CzcD-associated flavoprotein CzcO